MEKIQKFNCITDFKYKEKNFKLLRNEYNQKYFLRVLEDESFMYPTLEEFGELYKIFKSKPYVRIKEENAKQIDDEDVEVLKKQQGSEKITNIKESIIKIVPKVIYKSTKTVALISFISALILTDNISSLTKLQMAEALENNSIIQEVQNARLKLSPEQINARISHEYELVKERDAKLGIIIGEAENDKILRSELSNRSYISTLGAKYFAEQEVENELDKNPTLEYVIRNVIDGQAFKDDENLCKELTIVCISRLADLFKGNLAIANANLKRMQIKYKTAEEMNNNYGEFWIDDGEMWLNEKLFPKEFRSLHFEDMLEKDLSSEDVNRIITYFHELIHSFICYGDYGKSNIWTKRQEDGSYINVGDAIDEGATEALAHYCIENFDIDELKFKNLGENYIVYKPEVLEFLMALHESGKSVKDYIDKGLEIFNDMPNKYIYIDLMQNADTLKYGRIDDIILSNGFTIEGNMAQFLSDELESLLQNGGDINYVSKKIISAIKFLTKTIGDIGLDFDMEAFKEQFFKNSEVNIMLRNKRVSCKTITQKECFTM